MTAAHRDAIHGPVPTPEDEAALKEFSAVFKIEPFQRGMRELAPSVWITALLKCRIRIAQISTSFPTIRISAR